MEPGGRRPHRVLVADDDAAHRRTVARTLAAECAVETAAGGEEALARLAGGSFSLLISDQRMPGMTGVELLARAAQRHPRVVRVLLTAYAEAETLGEAINAGRVHAFLHKPWQPEALRLTVRRGLERCDAARERDALVERLRVACAASEREAENKARLLALLAHELGTPAHVALNASALLAEMELPAAAARWVESLQRASRWMARGVAQVHRAAGGAREPLRLRPTALDARAFVDAVAGEVRAAAAQRALRMTCTFERCAAPLYGDPRWLREALWNLLSNAVRNTPDGGAIEIRVRCERSGAAITVCDNGVGIAAERCDQIFEPFASVADVHLHGSGWLAFGARGLGLGLALTRRIAEAHGGRVWLRSAPRQGSCFGLEIPAVETVGERDFPSS